VRATRRYDGCHRRLYLDKQKAWMPIGIGMTEGD
jgi:hypothetical protein